MIDVTDIHVGERLRALDQKKVDVVAESMASQGQLHAILLRGHRDGTATAYELVAGLHRLEAAKQLGWSKIRATRFVEQIDDDKAMLAEIDENLCRAELSAAERAAHIGRRNELYEKLNPETKHGAAPGKAGGGKKAKGTKLGSFASATAKATGESKTKIKRDAKRAKELGDRLNRINGTSLDKGVEMDALAKLPEEEQEALVVRAAAGEIVSAKAELAAKKSRAKSEPPAPVTGSVERPIEAVKAAGGALAGEAPADDSPIGEAQQPAEAPSTNGHTKPDDDRPLAEKLHYHLNDIWSLCQDANNWSHLDADQKVELRGAMTKLGYLRELLPRLATPAKSTMH
jgi:ParB family chromosome partitioning protein